MDRGQFIQYVESNQRDLRRFLTALCCGDSALADDLAQETLLKAYLACDSFREECRFSSWIYRIAYNTFVSNRRGHTSAAPLAEGRDVAGSERADRAFEYDDLYSALDRLSAKERSAILLHYMQGYSIAEIAGITECSEDAVKQQLSRGRQHLKGFLNNQPYGGR
ncbi:MAG: RNA polymerase sigma factor [Muribaculaceae bacterium]|nr:RNA polymerase sigma factor [Muribaculaceae bacterium]